MILNKIKLNNSGFSLVEVLVVVFIIAVAFTAFYSVATVGTKYIIESKNRLGAVAFANEKMEIIRNLPYEKVGTLENVEVPGNIPQTETVTSNGRSYTVLTLVRYFDDPTDGTTGSSPADSIPNDYKVVNVVVSWNNSDGQIKKVSSSSRFVPQGLETNVGGSPLSINVSDGDTLLPIPQAVIHITNNTVSPAIDDTISTDNDGRIMLPAARISEGNHLSITKNGYETIETMDSSATFTPVYGHPSVVAGFLNTYNYFQNKLANLTVKTVDLQDVPAGGIEFFMGGGKIIGHDDLNNNIFSMSNALAITNEASGEKEYNNISSGNYTATMNSNLQYEFVDYYPSASPFFLSSGSDEEYKLIVADKNVNALFLKINDADISHVPIAGAKVTLKDGEIDIFTEKVSSLRGVVFYPNGSTVLENKEYALKVEADGYSTNTQLITIDKLTQVEVDLTKI